MTRLPGDFALRINESQDAFLNHFKIKSTPLKGGCYCLIRKHEHFKLAEKVQK